jgi:hypothetical protein
VGQPESGAAGISLGVIGGRSQLKQHKCSNDLAEAAKMESLTAEAAMLLWRYYYS